MAVAHTIFQFRLEHNNLANDAIDKIEKILLRYGLQDCVTETFRSNTKPILLLVAGDAR